MLPRAGESFTYMQISWINRLIFSRVDAKSEKEMIIIYTTYGTVIYDPLLSNDSL